MDYSNKLLIKKICQISNKNFIDLSDNIERLYTVQKKTKEYSDYKHKNSIRFDANLMDCQSIIIIDDITTVGNTSRGMLEIIRSKLNKSQRVIFFTFGKTILDFQIPYVPKDILIPSELLA